MSCTGAVGLHFFHSNLEKRHDVRMTWSEWVYLLDGWTVF